VGPSSHRTLVLAAALVSTACGGEETSTAIADASAAIDDATAVDASPPSTHRPIQLATATYQMCALFDDGTVSCWGVPGAESCAIAENGDGTVWCHAPDGGVTETTNVAFGTPTAVAGVVGASALAVGFWADCVVSQSGVVSCWGDDNKGVLGDGQTGPDLWNDQPIEVLSIPSTSIVAGGSFGCALEATGGVSCWGVDVIGQLGPGGVVGGTPQTPTSVVPLPPSRSIVATFGSVCSLDDGGAVRCWGANYTGALCSDSMDASTACPTPTPIAGLPSDVQSIFGGSGGNPCATTDAGALWCWGWNVNGLVTPGPAGGDVSPPTNVPGLSNVTQASMGWENACAVVDGGALYCWGAVIDSLFPGDGGWPIEPPTLVTGIPPAAQVVVGEETICMLGVDGTVWCWGDNSLGSCGPVSATNVTTPVQVPF
jgi:alpha-tubulin suppressor-like RCC1 family protein